MKTNPCTVLWRALLAQAHQMLARFLAGAALCTLFTASHPVSAQVWTPTGAPQITFLSVASSADGLRLIASGDDTYVSTNSGSTWSLCLPGVGGIVASSTNGARLLVVSSAGIFSSSNSGTSWTTNTSLSGMVWQGVAASADGTKLAAIALEDADGNPGLIYVSADSGNTWTTASAPGNSWSSVASSADGTKLVASVSDDQNIQNYSPGPIYISTDSGSTWIPTTAPNSFWTSVACSADGTRLSAVAYRSQDFSPAPIYTSTDSGTTWIPHYATTNLGAGWNWRCVASSADGMKLTAFGTLTTIYDVALAGVILNSTNCGTNWSATTTLLEYWTSAASSADGNKVVVASTGDIFTDGAATSWTLSGAPRTNVWQSIAASQDGSRLVAGAGASYLAGSNGPVYLSTNGGATWVAVPSLNTNGTVAVASSPDGSTLLAAGAAVALSTNSGASWWLTPAPATGYYCTSAAFSTNAGTLAVVGGGWAKSGSIYVSTNSGASWTPGSSASTNGGWSSVACSWDGKKMVAAQYYSSFTTPPYNLYPGYIYTSTNSGSTWSNSSRPWGAWTAVASSADGTRLLAVSQPIAEYGTPGLVYFSTNSGATWSSNDAVNTSWVSAACSADGAKFVAVDNAGLVLISTNSGATWATNLAPIVPWQSVAMSGDGTKIFAGISYAGPIYISQSVQAAALPWLSISLSGNQAFLTWPTNAAGFALQQNTNLLTTNWLAVTNTPVITNLLYRATVSPTNRQNFYRLEHL